MVRKQGVPVGRGYMPKGGAQAAHTHNQSWRDRVAALQLEQAAAAAPSVEPARPADADTAKVRASAPESGAVPSGSDGFVLGVVERWLFVGAGFTVGVLVPLALRVS